MRSRIAFGFLLMSVMATCNAVTNQMTLEVDARDVIRGIQHSHLSIPVSSGPLTLVYPKWIPGQHAVTGPITQLVSLKISGKGKQLAWRRDPLDAFLFRLEVPTGVDSLDVDFDYLSPPKSFAGGFGRTPNITPHLVILPFNHFILYPRETSPSTLLVRATVHIPANWRFDSALRPEQDNKGTLSFPVTSLERLVDSPVLAGEYFRTIPITNGGGSTRISVAADSPADLLLEQTTIDGVRRLVPEAEALFGGHHFLEYVWLVALGRTLEINGLEHHESSDIRDVESLFTDPERLLESRVIPHEFVHSWNGKYRRPDGLATGNYHDPMVDDLLWVYEGMTRYLGDLVLRTRSGLSSPEQSREYLAWLAAQMDKGRSGRSWRSVADTATAQAYFRDSPPEWATIRRSQDYYDEMLLVWLEADVRIREATHGRHSLDDFCRGFFGGGNLDPAVMPYSRADLVKALTTVAPLDWDAFFTSRVDAINARAPLDGIERSGWNLVYDDSRNAFQTVRERFDGVDNMALSLGLWVNTDGMVVDVVAGSPAFEAGISPTMYILAIDGHRWTAEAARDAIVRAETSSKSIQLVFQGADLVHIADIDYHQGLRNPHLVRDPTRPDVLSRILHARRRNAARAQRGQPDTANFEEVSKAANAPPPTSSYYRSVQN